MEAAERQGENKGGEESSRMREWEEVTLRSWMQAHAKQRLWISLSFYNPLSDPPMLGPII